MVVLGRQSDVEVGTQRSGHVLREELAQASAVIRRTTSPTRNPWVSEWYPAVLPGSQSGACAANRAVADGQS
jgi:hypothetical protein